MSAILDLRRARVLAGMLAFLTVAPSYAQLTALFVPSDPSPGSAAVSMQPGAAIGESFDVEIRITGIDDVFGLAFDLQFDPAVAIFVGFDSSGSFLEADGAQALFLVDSSVPGLLTCGATRVGPVTGIDAGGPPGSDLLLTLSFSAVSPTAGSAFSFGPPATRAVVSCPSPVGPCDELPDAGVTWSGGTLTSSVVALPASSPSSIALFAVALLTLLALPAKAARLRRSG